MIEGQIGTQVPNGRGNILCIIKEVKETKGRRNGETREEESEGKWLIGVGDVVIF